MTTHAKTIVALAAVALAGLAAPADSAASPRTATRTRTNFAGHRTLKRESERLEAPPTAIRSLKQRFGAPPSPTTATPTTPMPGSPTIDPVGPKTPAVVPPEYYEYPMRIIAKKGKIRLKSANFERWTAWSMRLPAKEAATLRVARPKSGETARVRCGVAPLEMTFVPPFGPSTAMRASGTVTVDVDGTVTSTTIAKSSKDPRVEFAVSGGTGAVKVKLSSTKLWSLSGCDLTIEK